MSKLLVGLLAVSIAGNAYFFLKPQDVVIKTSEPEKVVVKETETIAVTDEEFRNKYNEALKTLADTEMELNRVQSELDVFLEREALAKIEDEINKNVEEQVASGKFEMTEEFAKKQEEQRKAVIDLFAKESIEATWAYQTQDEIKRVLAELGDSDSYEIDDLVCKTSVCRLKLNPYNQSQAAQNMAIMNVSMAMAMGGEKLHGLRTAGSELLREDGQNSVLIYLVKGED